MISQQHSACADAAVVFYIHVSIALVLYFCPCLPPVCSSPSFAKLINGSTRGARFNIHQKLLPALATLSHRNCFPRRIPVRGRVCSMFDLLFHGRKTRCRTHTRRARIIHCCALFCYAPSCALPEKDQIDRSTRALSHAQKNPHPLSCWPKISFRSNQSQSRNAYEIFRLFCSSQKKREV